MENTFKICNQCGTENKPDSKFCKKCGFDISQADLETKIEEVPEVVTEAPEESVSEPELKTEPQVAPPVTTALTTAFSNPDYIKDIKKSSIKAFMGQSSEKLYNKYTKYCDNRSVWNWPVFFFSLLGIPFVWFFYRKMYKVGLIVLAIWFALTFSTALTGTLALNSASDPITSFADTSFGIIENEMRVASGVTKQTSNTKTVDREFNKTLEFLMTDAEIIVYLALSALLLVAQIVFVFILPSKANRFYYSNMEKNLRKFKENNATDEEISLAGGTNVTAAVVSGFAVYAAIQLVNIIPLAIVGSELVSQLINSFLRFLKNLGVSIRWKL